MVDFFGPGFDPRHLHHIKKGLMSLFYFISFLNQYNYGNPDEEKRVNYPNVSAGYIHESTRFMVSYGRQRAGLFCVGGVCRFVPANNGLTISFTQSF